MAPPLIDYNISESSGDEFAVDGSDRVNDNLPLFKNLPLFSSFPGDEEDSDSLAPGVELSGNLYYKRIPNLTVQEGSGVSRLPALGKGAGKLYGFQSTYAEYVSDLIPVKFSQA